MPGSTRTGGFAINDAGQVVGQYRDGTGYHGFLLSDGSFSTVDYPGSISNQAAAGINDSGSIVGTYRIQHGYLATPAQSDLAVTPPTWNAAQGGVDFNYAISGADLTKATTAALYWSADTTFDPTQDTLIPGSVTTTQTAIGTYPVHIDAATLGTPPSGTKYLLAVVDPANMVVESDETDNVVSLTLPDLQVNTLDWNVAQGGVDIGYNIDGSDLPDLTRIALYWSADAQFDPSDTLVDSAFTETAQRQDPYQLHVDRDQLGTPPNGTKYLLAVGDPQNIVAEADETNNVASLALPDLVGLSFHYSVQEDRTHAADGPLPFNAHFAIDAKVDNTGLGDASSFVASFYASKDATISTGDVLLAQKTVSLLAAGAETEITLSNLQLPQTLDWTGKIYLGMIVDPSNSLTEVEASRANNANQGNAIDRALVQLYDPISATVEMASGFKTERDAALYLFRSGYLPPLAGGMTWSHALPSSQKIVSRFDGVARLGLAFHTTAVIQLDAATGKYLILLNPTPAPNPDTASIFNVLTPGWLDYVKDWSKRF